MSTTIIASLVPPCARYAAPLILFVGPLEKVLMGSRDAISPLRIVPSFWLKKTGQVNPSRLIGSWNEQIVFFAKGKIEAFKIAAFSRSKNPRLATSLERTT